MLLQEFLEKLSRVKGGPKQYTAQCPAHPDKTNSLSIGQGEDGRILIYCHAGCSSQQILDTMGLRPTDLFPHSKSASVQRGIGEVNLQICKSEPPETVYSYENAEGFLLFEVVRKSLPNGKKSFLQRCLIDGKYHYSMDGIEPVLYQLPRIHNEIKAENGVIYLCEGEKDADRLNQLGFTATTAPMGAGKWKDSYTRSLIGAAQVYIVPDNDGPGRKHGLQAAESLENMGIPVRLINLLDLVPDLPDKGDVSDVLNILGSDCAQKFSKIALDLETFRLFCVQKDAKEAASAYLFDSAVRYLDTEFVAQIEEGRSAIPLQTGFSAFDRQVEGHLYPGLYVIGSVSSLGKTAFCLQMADAMAQAGEHVLFFTLEMSRLEMLSRTLVRQLFMDSKFSSSYSVGDLLYGRVPTGDLRLVMDWYRTGPGPQISFIESGSQGIGLSDITELAQRHASATGKSPVIFVDYLQILRPETLHMTDKQAMDASVVALKRLSRDLKKPVIAVSSFNRQNYSESVNLSSFKESGAIEYSADFVLGLQARGVNETHRPELDERKAARLVNAATIDAKKQNPRPIEAVTLKNRRGPAWSCFSLDFYPKENLFIEVSGFSF